MQTISVNIKNKSVQEKILCFLKNLENEGVEIISQEDLDDLKTLISTRGEEAIPFSDYLDNENNH
jgi:hypothetical protein